MSIRTYDCSMSREKNYSDIICGEIKIIHEELESLCQTPCAINKDLLDLIERITAHLASIEQRVGKLSIDYINICTEIVDVVSNRILIYINGSFSEDAIDRLSAQETVKLYANQRQNLLDVYAICKKLESWNIDYSYRIKKFNPIKKSIEDLCREKHIDIRSSMQKSVDRLKSAGEITGVVVKETAGCAIGIAIKVAIVIVIFLILMAIFGVK